MKKVSALNSQHMQLFRYDGETVREHITNKHEGGKKTKIYKLQI